MGGRIGLDTALGEVLGSNRAGKLRTELKLGTVGDLLRHYPRRYQERSALTDFSALPVGEEATVLAEVVAVDARKYRRKPGTILTARIGDGSGRTMDATFFNQAWRKGELAPGRRALFSGQVSEYRGRRQLTHPNYQLLRTGAEEEFDPLFTRALIPVYPATSKLSSWHVAQSMGKVLKVLDGIPDPMPVEILQRHRLLGLDAALHAVHQPDSRRETSDGRRRLTWDEAFTLQLELARRRAAAQARPAVPRRVRSDGLLAEFDRRLPYTLTAGQQEVSRSLFADLAGAQPMLRLLEGEVGSGKTVVALRAMLAVADSGGQAVLLAPTEVLAMQHARTVAAMLGDLAWGGQLGGATLATRVALLTGSLSASARREALLDVASGAAGIVIGTHALLQDAVQFADLGLVVVDEQHRFGVEQRDALRWKADRPPHVLVMTATPIPRTVAMTVFGDLESSVLRELPAGRASVTTTVVPSVERPTWAERAWRRVAEEVAQGRQAFVVCPRIGEDPDDARGTAAQAAARDADDSGEEVADVIGTFRALTEEVLPDLSIGLLHGRLPAEQKDAVMTAFAAGDIEVLVATTVIEVGVDVPNATVMVIRDADRFGASQLHQLRGRVGRGSHPGLCLMETRSASGTPARQRLDQVASTLDGFEVARMDLEQRREGDILGALQSGRSSHLRLLSLQRHEDLIFSAREEVAQLLSDDPGLLEHPELAHAVSVLFDEEQAAYLEKA